MTEIKSGKETTEWKAWLVAICGALALGIGNILAAGLIDDKETVYQILGISATILGVIGGVTVNYSNNRSKVKIESLAQTGLESIVRQSVAEALGSVDKGSVEKAPEVTQVNPSQGK